MTKSDECLLRGCGGEPQRILKFLCEGRHGSMSM